MLRWQRLLSLRAAPNPIGTDIFTHKPNANKPSGICLKNYAHVVDKLTLFFYQAMLFSC